MSIEIPARARADIDTASEELAERYGPATAHLFQERLARTLRQLEALPLSSQRVEPPYPGYPEMRLALVTKFEHRLIFYTPTETGIRVIRVLHSSLDADTLRVKLTPPGS